MTKRNQHTDTAQQLEALLADMRAATAETCALYHCLYELCELASAARAAIRRHRATAAPTPPSRRP